MVLKPAAGCARAFILHVSQDKAGFVEPLVRELASMEAAPTLDTWEIKPGDSLVKKLLESELGPASAVIAVISASSEAEPWVREELHAAAVRRVTGSARLIAVRLDDAPMPAPMRHLAWINAERTQEGIRAAAARITKALHGPGSAANRRTTRLRCYGLDRDRPSRRSRHRDQTTHRPQHGK